ERFGARGAALRRRQTRSAHRPHLAQDQRAGEGVPPARPGDQGSVSGGQVTMLKGNVPKGNVLVLGATGFIGRRIVAALLDAGYAPVGGVRRPRLFERMFPGCQAVACDLAHDIDPAHWLPRLAGIQAVVNCAGVLTDRHSRAVHVDAPKALHAACEQAGLRRIIHISAISASEDAGTAYAGEKRAAEIDLQRRDLDWVVLRPSLVFAEGSHGGTSALRGM